MVFHYFCSTKRRFLASYILLLISKPFIFHFLFFTFYSLLRKASIMVSTAQGYLNALLALSVNPALADARQNILTNLTDDELDEVIGHGLHMEYRRLELESYAERLLDSITAGHAAKDMENNQIMKARGNIGGQSDKQGKFSH